MQPGNINKCRCWTTFHLSNLLIALLFSVVLATLSLAAPSDLYTTLRNRDRTNKTPVSSILNPDGLVKPGSSGSFDPKGFRMVTGVDGARRFVPDHGTQGAVVEGVAGRLFDVGCEMRSVVSDRSFTFNPPDQIGVTRVVADRVQGPKTIMLTANR